MGWIISAVLLAVAMVFLIAVFATRREHKRAAIEQQTAKLKERIEHVLELADIWFGISDRDEIAIELLRLGQESLDSILALSPRNRYATRRLQDINEKLADIDNTERCDPTTILGSADSIPTLTQQLKAIKRILRIRLHTGFLDTKSLDSYVSEIDKHAIHCALDTYIHFGESAMAEGDTATAQKYFRQALEMIRKTDVLDRTVEAYFKRVSALNNQLGTPTSKPGEEESNQKRHNDPA